MTDSARKRKVGSTGIEDGLSWGYLCSQFEAGDPAVILNAVWWWRHGAITPSLCDYLAQQHDWGRETCFAYEAVARLQRKYPADFPINMINGFEADNFRMEYQVSADPRHGVAAWRDTVEAELARLKDPESITRRRQVAEFNAYMAEAYSEPFVFRFNLHQPPGSAGKMIKNFVAELQKRRGGVVTRKNRHFISFKTLESWDLRRWTEDDPAFRSKAGKLIEGVALSPPKVTKARNYAVSIANQFKAISEADKKYAHLDGGRPAFVKNPFW